MTIDYDGTAKRIQNAIDAHGGPWEKTSGFGQTAALMYRTMLDVSEGRFHPDDRIVLGAVAWARHKGLLSETDALK